MSGGSERLARGTAYSIAAQILAASLGFILTIFLGRFLGPEIFGRYGVIISFLAWIEFLVITGIPDTVARFVASDETRRRGILNTGIRLEIPLVLGIFSLFFLLSPFFARNLFHSPELTFYFRLASVDIPLYGLFSLYLGYLRGIRGFARQALGIVVYAGVKCGSVVVLVLSEGLFKGSFIDHPLGGGAGLSGALIGNAVGSAVALLLVRFLVSRDIHGEPSEPWPWRSIASYATKLVVCVFLFQALLNTDLWMVKRILTSRPEEVGLYTAVWNMARTPYYIFMGLSVALFPSISKTLASGNVLLTSRYIRQSIRLYLLVALPIVVIMATTAPSLMQLTFGERFLPHDSGTLLSVLICGYCLISFSLVYATVLMADGRMWLTVSMNLALLAAEITLAHLLISRFGLAGATLSTIGAGSLSLLAGQYTLSRLYGSSIPPLTPLRALLASLIPAAPLLFLPLSGVLIIPVFIIFGIVYIGLLFLFREIDREEISRYLSQIRPGV